MASGGTLFLDEVPELSARAQAKLLRVIQQQEVRRLGEAVTRPVDVRIVAAANRCMTDEVTAGRFRADLLYRLDVVRLRVPPLRERLEDVPPLAEMFWDAAAARVGSAATLGDTVLRALAAYAWPGNVRELQNVMAALAVSAPSRGRVPPSLLPARIREPQPRPPTLAVMRTACEREAVRAALARAAGCRAAAARELGLTRQGCPRRCGGSIFTSGRSHLGCIATARRLALTVPVLLGVATLVFSLIHLIPGDPAQRHPWARRRPDGHRRTARRLKLDGRCSSMACSLGLARRSRHTVAHRRAGGACRAARVPATAELAAASMLVAVAVALPLGIAAAVWRGRPSTPAPPQLRSPVSRSRISGWGRCWRSSCHSARLASSVGPRHDGASGAAGGVAGQRAGGHPGSDDARHAARELREPYARAACGRRRGRAPSLRHAFRNTCAGGHAPCPQFGAVLTGAVITETIFAWPGIGRLLIQSIGFRDYPMVQGCILFIAVTYVAVNLLTDLVYGVLDPRIRYE
jgi:ABC-type dipeptide/oligopeptide/nickel transport system permease component